MLNSKKRNKQLVVTFIICIGVLAVLLGLLYVKNNSINASKEDKKVVVDKGKDHYGAFVKTSNKTNLYTKKGKKFVKIGYQNGINDLTTSSQKLYNAFVFCYPFGDYNDNAKIMLKDAGYTMAFTVEYGYVSFGMDKLQLPRIRMSGSTTVASFAALLEG